MKKSTVLLQIRLFYAAAFCVVGLNVSAQSHSFTAQPVSRTNVSKTYSPTDTQRFYRYGVQ